jgi:tRNA C32,U32 (ribose-2'-O)-methylase TrmJ
MGGILKEFQRRKTIAMLTRLVLPQARIYRPLDSKLAICPASCATTVPACHAIRPNNQRGQHRIGFQFAHFIKTISMLPPMVLFGSEKRGDVATLPDLLFMTATPATYFLVVRI